MFDWEGVKWCTVAGMSGEMCVIDLDYPFNVTSKLPIVPISIGDISSRRALGEIMTKYRDKYIGR